MEGYFIHLILSGSFFYFAFDSIRNILIGKGKINNPMYDTIEKKQYVYKKGIIGVIFNFSIGILYITIVFLLFFTRGKK